MYTLNKNRGTGWSWDGLNTLNWNGLLQGQVGRGMGCQDSTNTSIQGPKTQNKLIHAIWYVTFKCCTTLCTSQSFDVCNECMKFSLFYV